MKHRSPTLEGFRAIFRQPALGMAEIAWRWSLGTAATLLLVLGLLAYLDTPLVTNADLLFLRTRQPFLISQAIAHIFRGSALRFVMASIVLFIALSLGWVLTASFGRAATLKWLLEYFRAENKNAAAVPDLHSATHHSRTGIGSLAGLNFLRVATSLAAAVGCIGAVILAGFASSAENPRPGLVFLLLVPLVGSVWLFWRVLNWFLSLAAVFVVRDQQDTFGALAKAVSFCRETLGPVLAVGSWFGVAHIAAFVVATSVVAVPMAFVGILPAAVVLGGILLVTLLYFAVVDFLYVGQLAAYVAIVEAPEEIEPLPAIRLVPRPAPWGGIPPSEDDIVSDVPDFSS